MDQPPDPEPRLAALETRVERVEGQAAVARHDAAAARLLAAGADHDNADLKVEVDALRRVLNAHAEQTAARFDRLEGEMRTGFAKAAVGQQLIVDLLTREDRD